LNITVKSKCYSIIAIFYMTAIKNKTKKIFKKL